MKLGPLPFLGGILQPVREAFDSLVTAINLWSNREHGPEGQHGDITASDLVVTRLRFPTGQSAARGHLVIVDDKAYGRPALDFGDATQTQTSTSYGSGGGYDLRPWARIWVSTATAGSTLSIGTSNNHAAGVTNTALSVDPSGNIGFGTTSPAGLVHAAGTSATIYNQGVAVNAIWYGRRGNGTLAAPTVVATGQAITTWQAQGYDGAAWIGAAAIEAQTEGTIAANRMPSRLVFFTSTDAAPSVVTERIRLDSAGNTGFGTTAPAARIHVNITAGNFTSIFDNPNASLSTYADAGGAGFFRGKTVATLTGWYISPANNAEYLVNASGGIFRIDATGNVGIGGTANANAILDCQSTTKPFMPPRMTTVQRDAVASPTAGMVIMNTTTGKLNVYTTIWEAVTSA